MPGDDEDVLKRLANSHLPILILGESGVGKEELAERLVTWSSRRRKPFEKLNCGAVQDSLLESELFGHEKGAFTDARTLKKGRFELADQGTLFLDEIGELSPTAQVKLLHFLENREFTRVGGVEKRTVDVRVLAATHRSVCPPAAYHDFREDLYYRLAGAVLYLPPLRERRDEIIPLAERFVALLCQKEGWTRRPQLSSEACAELRAYGWPGNIRELRNTIERAVIICRDGTIREADLRLHLHPRSVREQQKTNSPHDSTTVTITKDPENPATLSEPEPRGAVRPPPDRATLLRVLEHCRWNRGLVAQQLEVSRTTLYKWLCHYGLIAENKADGLDGNGEGGLIA
jgi:DNA-binding NtrC family response regulator